MAQNSNHFVITVRSFRHGLGSGRQFFLSVSHLGAEVILNASSLIVWRTVLAVSGVLSVAVE